MDYHCTFFIESDQLIDHYAGYMMNKKINNNLLNKHTYIYNALNIQAGDILGLNSDYYFAMYHLFQQMIGRCSNILLIREQEMIN